MQKVCTLSEQSSTVCYVHILFTLVLKYHPCQFDYNPTDLCVLCIYWKYKKMVTRLLLLSLLYTAGQLPPTRPTLKRFGSCSSGTSTVYWLRNGTPRGHKPWPTLCSRSSTPSWRKSSEQSYSQRQRNMSYR